MERSVTTVREVTVTTTVLKEIPREVSFTLPQPTTPAEIPAGRRLLVRLGLLLLDYGQRERPDLSRRRAYQDAYAEGARDLGAARRDGLLP